MPFGLFEKLRKRHPHLTQKECQLVAKGLRQYFLAYQASGYGYVSMPSQVADDLWHEFILHTKAYQDYCQGAFGRFFHHTPAAALGAARKSNEGLRRCWLHACREENIDPRSPTRLPLLFALDAKLNIAHGFTYATDCRAIRSQEAGSNTGTTVHCGGDFSDSSIDGGTDGLGDGDAGSDGSGGGDGCGGGCGGD